jgi:RNA polymerase sigma factor (TIGR02999 family)
VYDELKRLARRYLRRERSSQTLQPTALVNEAYIQLSAMKAAHWQNRSHFPGVAALAMRRVLTDYARGRRAAKRGQGQLTISLGDSSPQGDPLAWDFDDLDVALSKLEVDAGSSINAWGLWEHRLHSATIPTATSLACAIRSTTGTACRMWPTGICSPSPAHRATP